MHGWAISLYIVKAICNINRIQLFLLYFCFVLDTKFKAKWNIFFLAHAFSRWLCVSFLFHVCILFLLWYSTTMRIYRKSQGTLLTFNTKTINMRYGICYILPHRRNVPWKNHAFPYCSFSSFDASIRLCFLAWNVETTGCS